jgi:hypothetical protein
MGTVTEAHSLTSTGPSPVLPFDDPSRDPLPAQALLPERLPALVPRLGLQACSDRNLPCSVRNPRDVRGDHVGRRIRVTRQRRLLHPGAVGITQATNALALKTCCDVTRETAVAYSAAQQLIGVSRSARRRAPLIRQLAQRGAYEHPQTLIRSADHHITPKPFIHRRSSGDTTKPVFSKPARPATSAAAPIPRSAVIRPRAGLEALATASRRSASKAFEPQGMRSASRRSLAHVLMSARR